MIEFAFGFLLLMWQVERYKCRLLKERLCDQEERLRYFVDQYRMGYTVRTPPGARTPRTNGKRTKYANQNDYGRV